MKLLRYNGAFKLSDDFNGDLADALIELANYHRRDEAKQRRSIGRKPSPDRDVRAHHETTNEWHENFHSTGNPHLAYVNIFEIKDGTVSDMPLVKD